MPIIKNNQWSDDPWAHLDDEGTVPDNGAVTISLTRWLAECDTLAKRTAPLGLRLKPEERAQAVGADAENFDLIVVELPYFKDGRAFSTARLLRERYGFAGDIRATGHILPDQFLYLLRCGVSSIEVPAQTNIKPFSNALKEYTVGMQNTRAGRGLAPELKFRSAAFKLAHAAE